jgi:hypothetical protein
MPHGAVLENTQHDLGYHSKDVTLWLHHQNLQDNSLTNPGK